MKKIFTFLLGSFIALSVAAAERQPTVSINASNNYEIKIDGQTYSNNTSTSYLSQGTHTVEVYEIRKALFGKRRVLVSTNRFDLRNNDVRINVDNNGQVRINESRSSRVSGRNNNDDNVFNRRGDDRRDNDNVFDRDNKQKSKKAKKGNGYGHGKGKGKGHQKHGDDRD